eukprot:scaffold13134_cov69-Phaeocystis_antarctica.AAC.7
MRGVWPSLAPWRLAPCCRCVRVCVLLFGSRARIFFGNLGRPSSLALRLRGSRLSACGEHLLKMERKGETSLWSGCGGEQ